MSKLNGDILYYIFNDLYYSINRKDKQSLHSCLLVNKLWCEVMIPILYGDNSIKFLKDKSTIGANFKKQKLTFNYIRFCKYLDDIYYIFSNRSSLLKEEIYKLFISECSSIKSLCMDMLDYPIYQYPGVNISLSNLYELDCNIKEQNFYHELAQICRSIEKIRILIHEHDELDGLVELIEKHKQIKYICISESGENKIIAQALEKHANSIILFSIAVRTSFLYFLFPKLINLQFLKIYDGPLIHSRSNKLFNNMINESYYDLQILELKYVSLDVVINIIQNTNGNLLKVYITFADDRNQTTKYNQAIHKYCLNIKYVTVYLNTYETLEELENIFIKCHHLEEIDIDGDIFNIYKFLSSIKSAPLTLNKILLPCRYFDDESIKLFSARSKKTLHFDYHDRREMHKFIKYYKIIGSY
ncbi:hypothetical protein RhiirA5_425605 [Rhizophagus irregularis]|uniref:F-box domain-containing protein n=1 Tax=Rhizophagus irregularis TaxID=588596 RepID=A0A2N0P5T7_9GLOM|nr:hypothetical protein RhiirA5_425605 [Rhizophagus irregularis]